MKLKEFTRPECDRFLALCNFTDEEREVFELRVTGKDRTYIADALGMSVRTVDRRLSDVKQKVVRVLWQE